MSSGGRATTGEIQERPRSSTRAAGSATVYLNPTYANVVPGQLFTVNVNIRNAGNVGSVPFHLTFDPTMLDFLNYSRSSPFLSQGGAQPFILATLGPGKNEVIVGLSRQGNLPGASGDGDLIDLTFRAIRAGTVKLDFSDVAVLDPSAQRQASDHQGMTVNVQAAPAGGGR